MARTRRPAPPQATARARRSRLRSHQQSSRSGAAAHPARPWRTHSNSCVPATLTRQPISRAAPHRAIGAAVKHQFTIIKQVEIVEARPSPCSLSLGEQDVWQGGSCRFAARRPSISGCDRVLCDPGFRQRQRGRPCTSDRSQAIARGNTGGSGPHQWPAQKPVRGIPTLEAQPVALRPLPRRRDAGFPDRPRGRRLDRGARPFDVGAGANGEPFAQRPPTWRRHCCGRLCQRRSRGVGNRGDALHIRIPRRLILGGGIIGRLGLGGHRLTRGRGARPRIFRRILQERRNIRGDRAALALDDGATFPGKNQFSSCGQPDGHATSAR